MRQQPIQAGVILKSRFTLSKNRKFQEYIDYIDREEAVRNENFEKFSSYNDYMGNPEKTTGLFTADKDSLDEKEKLELKHLFRMAQQNNSVMWQNVISFDNRWLEQHGIIDRKTKTIDEEKLRTAARQSTKIFLDKEGLSASAVWSASIHYNTDNIHIHIAIVEPFPTRKRGKVKDSTFTACKSKVVNTIIDYNLIHQKLNQIIRERIVERKKASPLAQDKEFLRSFLEVYQAMPQNASLWYYNRPELDSIRPHLDKLGKAFLETYCKEDYQEFETLLEKQAEEYRQAYGNTKTRADYAQGKRKDLYTRLGNAILEEMREYHRAQNSRNTSTQRNSPTARRLDTPSHWGSQLISSLRKMAQKDFESLKNQRVYEQVLEEQEYE